MLQVVDALHQGRHHTCVALENVIDQALFTLVALLNVLHPSAASFGGAVPLHLHGVTFSFLMVLYLALQKELGKI